MECAAEGSNKNQSDLTIYFPWGIPGLEYEHYTVIPLDPDLHFYFLQSTTDPLAGLLLINPFVVFKDYEFELSDDIIKQLKIKDEKQIAVLCTANTSKGIKSATVNLLAPIVINTKALVAKQVVLTDKRYSIRTPLFSNIAAEKEEP